MKTKLLLLTLFGFFAANAQTTYNLDWFMGIGTNVDLTIDQGDTVIWTWGDAAPHTVENEVGNSVETFNSGIITGMGETYSYTFTVVGDNRYLCGIHGAASMSGTITVREVLGVEENNLNKISLYPNPASSTLNLVLSKNMQSGEIAVYDILGKQIYSEEFESKDNISINIMGWNTGSYFLKVVSGENMQTERFIKN
ncbi:T9SS type A sorting domain-containing protein [Aequorivita antarctica]|uniref:T9SS type A sorting domain-containing protein n=1 Tax=Aequorivita antarctica TaxID=153266 RepID=A0A5C6Z449_9FLAO|nr:T9SS type A sorting domain-containing protein [Aequorivita antarctica]TXD74979.1 T9SS type A sorting domain-containing protein [Aequorivita antarctica]SRX72292.1 Plastocyanin [Aequorivita antarctica]